jgi:peptidyl-prolyl cis-trans isomerase SurA
MYREQILDDHVIEMTRDRFNDFESEIEGFLDGLVVFQVSDENIWNPESADTTALKTYYEEHKDQYRYEERYDYTLIASGSDSLLNEAIEHVESGENALELKDEMDGLLVLRDSVSAPSEDIRTALNELEPGELSAPLSYRNSQAVVRLHQLLPPRRMTFQEAINRVSSDYQPIREELFMSDLRERYGVQTFPERIQTGSSK